MKESGIGACVTVQTLSPKLGAKPLVLYLPARYLQSRTLDPRTLNPETFVSPEAAQTTRGRRHSRHVTFVGGGQDFHKGSLTCLFVFCFVHLVKGLGVYGNNSGHPGWKCDSDDENDDDSNSNLREGSTSKNPATNA